MLVIVLYFLFIKLQIITCQFPTHVDFQKIGEVTFNNEVYKVLKPQQHIVKESREAWRRDNTFPKEGILIDTNGRIHFWRGLIHGSDKSEQKKQNHSENAILRSLVENYRDQSKIYENEGLNPEAEKNYNRYDLKYVDDTIQKDLNVQDENRDIQGLKTITADALQFKTENFNEENTKYKSLDSEREKNKNETDEMTVAQTTLKNMDENDGSSKSLNETEDLNGEIENVSQDHVKGGHKSSVDNDLQAESESFNYESTTVLSEDITTTKKRRRRKLKKEIIPPNTVYVPHPLRSAKGKTVVKTTFFCPFLGIFTMSSLIDD